MDSVTVSAAIVAIVKVVKDRIPAVSGLVTVILAAVIGGISGYFHVQSTPDVLTGVVLGLTAVGAVSVVDRVGQKQVDEK